MDEQYATGYGQKTAEEAADSTYKAILESVNNAK